MFDFAFQIVTDPVSMERLLGQSGDLSRPQPVEYCVVCGDKASGIKACSYITFQCDSLSVFSLIYPDATTICFAAHSWQTNMNPCTQ